jgi:hypothetical protein
MADNENKAMIESVKDLLEEPLSIPDYQRPYRWTKKDITDLLGDIDYAINKKGDFKYRIGTIILHENEGEKNYDIVDGQQRIISLVLLRLALDADESFNCELKVKNEISQANIRKNDRVIKGWFEGKDKDYKEKIKKAFDDEILEAVVIIVRDVAEAFQLFDSQNTRGRELYPHDLLKAYHLREMKNYPYEMQHAVMKWDIVKDGKTKVIKDLFELYLFPIRQWASGSKSFPFSAKDIDSYKGIPENSPYTYAKRISRAMPYFQIVEPFIAGNDFFEMVEHYLNLLKDVETEITTNDSFSKIKDILAEYASNKSFCLAKILFICAVLCFYDRFRNFDAPVIKKLFAWAFMLRTDMSTLGFSSINKYAIGEKNDRYSNNIPMFSEIINARLPSEIANMPINVSRDTDKAENPKWNDLYEMLKSLMNN